MELETWPITAATLLRHSSDLHALAAAMIWYHFLHILLYAEPTIHDAAYTPKVSARHSYPGPFLKFASAS
jgi:hypothetical protein